MAKAKAKAKAKPKAKKAAKKTVEMVLVGSKCKEAIKSQGLMMSGELLPALNESVHCMIAKAAERAQANGRKTVQAKDL